MGKSSRVKIRLNSAGTNQKGKKTGYFKTTTKGKQVKDKVKIKCFDPRAWNPKTKKLGMHVEFVEGKIK